MDDFHTRFDAAHKAFDENTLSACDNETLQKHLLALSIESVPNTTIQHRNIIRGITINHVLLQRHIDSLNKQNSITQRWFMVFAVISAIGAVGPYLWPPSTPPIQVVVAQPSRIQQQLAPTLAKPPASHPATVKQH